MDTRNADGTFKTGHPGGPGRPKGSRSKLSDAFLKALADDFEDNVEVIAQIRRDNPVQYAQIIAKLMPKLMELSGPDGEAVEVFSRIERTVISGDAENKDS